MLQEITTKIKDPKSNLGVEISGLDLNQELSDAEINSIRNSWLKNGVAIFPNQELTHDNYQNFCLKFGAFGDDPYLAGLKDLSLIHI